jgi:hypothetical protein
MLIMLHATFTMEIQILRPGALEEVAGMLHLRRAAMGDYQILASL